MSRPSNVASRYDVVSHHAFYKSCIAMTSPSAHHMQQCPSCKVGRHFCDSGSTDARVPRHKPDSSQAHIHARTTTPKLEAQAPVMVMLLGCQSTLAPIRPMTSANLTSPCTLSLPQPSTVTVPPVIVAPTGRTASSHALAKRGMCFPTCAEESHGAIKVQQHMNDSMQIVLCPIANQHVLHSCFVACAMCSGH